MISDSLNLTKTIIKETLDIIMNISCDRYPYWLYCMYWCKILYAIDDYMYSNNTCIIEWLS